jgi:ribosome maturation factor RimP
MFTARRTLNKLEVEDIFEEKNWLEVSSIPGADFS